MVNGVSPECKNVSGLVAFKIRRLFTKTVYSIISPLGVRGSCQLIDKVVELVATTVGGSTLAGIPSKVVVDDSGPLVCATPLKTKTYKYV